MNGSAFDRCLSMLADGFEFEAAEERFGHEMASQARQTLKREGKWPMTDEEFARAVAASRLSRAGYYG